MLYDKRWEKPEIKADPFSLESLIAWLEKQPANKTYCYLDNGRCLLGLYLKAHGFENVHIWTHVFWHGDEKCPSDVGQDEAIALGKITRFPRDFDHIASYKKWAFGAALERARKALVARSR